jgi:hypothetical protein
MWMFFGFIWVMCAPLVLLIPIGLIYFVLTKFNTPERKILRWLLAAILPVAVVGAIWWQDRAEFQTLCASLGEPIVRERLPVDGIFLDDPTANSFGMRYLHDEGFVWVEARSIYKRDGFTRYEKTPTGITSKEVDAITARVAVESRLTQQAPGISIDRVTVRDRQDGRELATAARANFDGGRARWALGIWGTSVCPSLSGAAGSDAFRKFYHLGKLTSGKEP